MRRKKKSKTSRNVLIATMAIISIMVISLVIKFGPAEMTAFTERQCKTESTSQGSFGYQASVSACVDVPWKESEVDKYFTDGDKITISPSITGYGSIGQSFYFSSDTNGYKCYGKSLEPDARGQRWTCEGMGLLLGNGSKTYNLKPSDRTVIADSTGYVSYQERNGGYTHLWTSARFEFKNLIYYENKPFIECGEGFIIASNTGTPAGKGLEGEFQVYSRCDGTAVSSLKEASKTIGLGDSETIPYSANGNGECVFVMKGLSTGKMSTCVIDVNDFVQEGTPEETDIGSTGKEDSVDTGSSLPSSLLKYGAITSLVLLAVFFGYSMYKRWKK